VRVRDAVEGSRDGLDASGKAEVEAHMEWSINGTMSPIAPTPQSDQPRQLNGVIDGVVVHVV